MSVLREFFNGRIIINCILFALPISFLFMLRVIYVQDIPFFSMVAGKIFLYLVVMVFVLLRFFLFILYLLSRRAWATIIFHELHLPGHCIPDGLLSTLLQKGNRQWLLNFAAAHNPVHILPVCRQGLCHVPIPVQQCAWAPCYPWASGSPARHILHCLKAIQTGIVFCYLWSPWYTKVR